MRARVFISSIATFMLLGGLAVAPATAAGPIACPTALPTEKAVDGLKGTGYTVERGTTPAPFSATVLGRITDGIAPGIDMIMAELDSPAIQRAGLWAGMSGSPVYTKEGKLIGAVAYGLSLAPSPIAGITPAAEMKALLTKPPTSAPEAAVAEADHIDAPPAAVQRMVATGEATSAQAAAGFTRLALPVSVSGLVGPSAMHSQRQLHELAADLPNTRLFLGGAAPISGSAASEISAGSNFAASLSYGDVTLSGIGTTTFVCGTKAVAFGHPFFFSGPSSLSVHPANAVLVQVDNTVGSFKVANPGSPVGTLDQDRMAGIRGKLGVQPTTTTIRSDLSAVGGGSRVGTTYLAYQPLATDVVATHTLVNIDRVLDAIGPGSADVTLRVTGVRPNGQTFTVTRSARYADPYDISSSVAMSVSQVIDTIVNQPFEKVRITSVTLTGTVDPTYRAYQVSAVKVRQNGSYVVPTGPVYAKAGSTLPIRLMLSPLGGGTSRTLDLALPVPADFPGGFAQISAGQNFVDTSSATSFPQVLAALRSAPDAASAQAGLYVNGLPATAAAASADRALAPYDQYLEVVPK